MSKDNPDNSNLGFGGANADQLSRFGDNPHGLNHGGSNNGNKPHRNGFGNGHNKQGNNGRNGGNNKNEFGGHSKDHGGDQNHDLSGSDKEPRDNDLNGKSNGFGKLGNGKQNSLGNLGKQGGKNGFNAGGLNSAIGKSPSDDLDNLDNAGKTLNVGSNDNLVDNGLMAGDNSNDSNGNLGDDSGYNDTSGSTGGDGDLSKGLASGKTPGENNGSGQGLPNLLQNVTSSLPSPVRNAGGKVGELYGKVNKSVTHGVMKIGGKHLKAKAAQAIAHMLMASTLGLGGFGVYSVLHSQDQTLESDFLCQTNNDSGNDYQDGAKFEASGSWSQAGRPANKIFKMLYVACTKYMDPIKAAGIAGGAAQEDGAMDPNQPNLSGDGGYGFFQVTPTSGRESPLKYAAAHGIDLRDKNVPMQKKVDIEVQQYVEEFVKPSGYLTSKYHGSVSRMAQYGAQIEAGHLGAGWLPSNSNLQQRTAGAVYAYGHWKKDAAVDSQDIETADNNAATAEGVNNMQCNTTGYGDGYDGTIVKLAESFIGKVSYDQGNRDMDSNNQESADCSSFVWYIYKKLGYKVTSTPWSTVDMGEHMQEIPARNANRGDCVVVNIGSGSGDNGHTAILEQDWHGDNTMIINEGGSESNVNRSTFGEAFYPALRGGTMKFYRPIK